jgi:hypothetical protein
MLVTHRVPRLIPAFVGLGLLVLGAVKIAMENSAASAMSLVIAGALLIVSPLLIGRIEQLKVSGTGLELRLSREIEAMGAPKTAQIIERSNLSSLAECYSFVHEQLREPAFRETRVRLQDLLVERASSAARQTKFDPAEVRVLFADGTPMMRVLALGLMQGDPSLADFGSVASAITDSRTGNEQYQGLRLALQAWPSFSDSERRTIRALVAGAPHISEGSSRRSLADQLLALLPPS